MKKSNMKIKMNLDSSNIIMVILVIIIIGAVIYVVLRFFGSGKDKFSNYEDFQTKKRPFECGANLPKGGCCRNNCNCTSKKCNMNNQCD